MTSRHHHGTADLLEQDLFERQELAPLGVRPLACRDGCDAAVAEVGAGLPDGLKVVTYL